MKIYFQLLLFILFFPSVGLAQNDTIYFDEPPRFPGGEDALNQFIDSVGHYRQSIIDNRIEGTVSVKISLDARGHITAVIPVWGSGYGLTEEAVKIAGQLPRWIPANKSGRAVPSEIIAGISFSIRSREEGSISLAGIEVLNTPAAYRRFGLPATPLAGNTEAIFNPDVRPSYPGGIDQLIRDFASNFTPEPLYGPSKVINFVVGKDGIARQYTSANPRDTTPFLQEVINTLSQLEKWNPGISDGKPVAVYETLEILYAYDPHQKLNYLYIDRYRDTLDIFPRFKPNFQFKSSEGNASALPNRMPVLIYAPKELVPDHIRHPYTPPQTLPSHYSRPKFYNIDVRVSFWINEEGEVKDITLDSIYPSHLIKQVIPLLQQVKFIPAMTNGKPMETQYFLSYQFQLNELEWLRLPPIPDSVLSAVRAKCISGFKDFLKTGWGSPEPPNQFLSYNDLIQKNDTLPSSKLSAVKEIGGVVVWPFFAGLGQPKLFRNYTPYYIYDSVCYYTGVIAVNDTNPEDVKIIGGPFTGIELMLHELDGEGLIPEAHFSGVIMRKKDHRRYFNGKIKLSTETAALEAYAKILSRTFDPSLRVVKYEYRFSRHEFNCTKSYRGLINTRYHRNGEYEITVSTDAPAGNGRKTADFNKASDYNMYVSPYYPYASYNGFVPYKILFRINPEEQTIRVKIAESKDISTIPSVR